MAWAHRIVQPGFQLIQTPAAPQGQPVGDLGGGQCPQPPAAGAVGAHSDEFAGHGGRSTHTGMWWKTRAAPA